jgi:hypothetical protein
VRAIFDIMAHRLMASGKEERGYPKPYIHTVINASIEEFIVDIQGMTFISFPAFFVGNCLLDSLSFNVVLLMVRRIQAEDAKHSSRNTQRH